MKEIKLFGRALKNDGTLSPIEMSFEYVNKAALVGGYIIHPDCCNSRVIKWLNTQKFDIDTTFYQTWHDVESKSRLVLFFEQVLHYASTYGTGHTGEPYLPERKEFEDVKFDEYKVIEPITPEEIQEKIQGMFDSGIALKQETIEDCISLLKEFHLNLNVDTIKNREVMMYVCKDLDLLPSKPEEMVRYLVYLFTGNTLLIKDKATIQAIKAGNFGVKSLIDRYGIDRLSSVFYRFKPLFLAMKSKNSYTINRLRRLAKKNHKPYEFSYFEKLLAGNSDLSQLEKNLKYLNNFKKVTLLNTIDARRKQTGIRPFLIRNGKLFVKEQTVPNKDYYKLIYGVIFNSLVNSLKKKACKVKLHPVINLMVPTSEKSFIGNIPYGSYIDAPKSNIVVGINWKEVDGANDLDLSSIDISGTKTGWNSYYHGQGFTYSGDMTSANPEATELLYCKENAPDSIFKVNLYCGDKNSKYKLFIGKTFDHYRPQSRMLEPKDVVFSTELEMTSEEMSCGMLSKNVFVFANLNTGNRRISSGNVHTTNFIKHTKECIGTQLDVLTLLSQAGFEIVEDDADIDIDLSTLDKSSLINLFG